MTKRNGWDEVAKILKKVIIGLFLIVVIIIIYIQIEYW